ncbi:MAG: CPBP family intramembrane metalloprotease [Acidimicrobiales bacterium]
MPSRTELRAEVWLVLALSLGASGVYAALDLLKGLFATAAPLAHQTATLYAPRDSHVWLDVTYQLLDIVTELVPVLLVVYLLARSAESLATLGVDGRRPRSDATWSVGLALLVGAVGLGFVYGAKALGINRQLIVGTAARHWWTIVLLVGQAAGTAVAEEVIVGGFMLHRLRQIGWSDRRSLTASALVRGSYHLYQGVGGGLANVVLGVFFGRIYQRRGRVLPLIVAHFLIDAVAFVGYVELRGRVSWLP